MLDREKQPTGLMHSGEQLRKLLLEHPDLPLLVFAKDSANSGDYYAMSCTDISAEVGEFLDCQQQYNDCYCFTDRDEFRAKSPKRCISIRKSPTSSLSAKRSGYLPNISLIGNRSHMSYAKNAANHWRNG